MYLHEEHFYLISNHSVARNALFCDIGMQLHFKNKMKFYLEPICDILAYNLVDQEFQILVRLKDRKVFDEYFQEKLKGEGQIPTPESTYIFSQAMSNLQNSTVKKFNYNYGRSGTLMAGRFERLLLKSKEDVVKMIQKLNMGNSSFEYSGIWAESAMKRMEAMTSREMYRSLDLVENGQNNCFWEDINTNLVGNFELPQIEEQFFKFNYLNRRAFNSICKHFS